MNSETYVTVIMTDEGLNQKFRAGYNHALAMLRNGEAVELKVAPAESPISIKQRGFLHAAVLPQVAEQVCLGPNRERYTTDVWKTYFHKRFIPDRWVMKKLPGAKRATPHRERVSSEQLGVRRYSLWIDQIIDTAIAEFGVQFVFEGDEREQVRYRGPTKKGRAQ